MEREQVNLDEAVDDEKSLQRLRELLFGDEIKRLQNLHAKIEDPSQHAGQVAGVLAEAIEERNKKDDRIKEVLQPNIEEALHDSVHKDPRPLTEALFPIIGPAIRRSVAETLNGMFRSFNQVLESSLSIRSLRWRIEAWRTGQPFSQVVLMKTLVYQVEQVFLIHQGSGLLLGHVQSENAIVQDPDMVSGMLTAIRDFITDSFAVEEGDQLASLQLGDLTVLVRPGPQAVLAAAVRGTPPSEYSPLLSETLERYHQLYKGILRDYDGDNSKLEGGKYLLENCLQSQIIEEESSFSYKKPLLVAGLAILAFLIWTIQSWLQEEEWRKGVASLDAEPGIVVIKDSYDSDQNSISLLFDPIARTPEQVVGNEYLANFSPVWQRRPYASLEESIVLKRAHAVLKPPSTVKFSLNDSVLRITGAAKQSWIDGLGTLLPGVHSLDVTDLEANDIKLKPKPEPEPANSAELKLKAQLDGLSRELTDISFFFKQSAAKLEGSDDELQRLMPLLREIFEVAGSLGQDLRIEIHAYADPVGGSKLNRWLSQNRAEYILGKIGEEGLPVDKFEAIGGGIWVPPDGAAGKELQRYRRVDFRPLINKNEPRKGEHINDK